MRIALISDIHGNRWALVAVLDHIARQRVDAIWNLGHILSRPLEPAATAHLPPPLAPPRSCRSPCPRSAATTSASSWPAPSAPAGPPTSSRSPTPTPATA